MNYNNALSNLSDGSKVEKSEICLVFPSISIIAVSVPRVWLCISTCRTCHVLEMTSRVVRTRDADVPSISALIIHYNIIWNWLNSGDRTYWRMLVSKQSRFDWLTVAGSDCSLGLGPHLHHVCLQRRHGLHLHPQQEYYQIHQDEVIFAYQSL